MKNEFVTKHDLDRGFSLKAHDTTYRIVSFFITYPTIIQSKYALQTIKIEGAWIRLDSNYPRLLMDNSEIVAFDEIIVEDSGRQYKAQPFILPIRK